MYELPELIANDLRHGRDPDMAIDFLEDVIEKIGFDVINRRSSDRSISIEFKHDTSVNGAVCVDRRYLSWSADASDRRGQFMPGYGSWSDVCKYLAHLFDSITKIGRGCAGHD